MHGDEFAALVSGVSLLADPVRRTLYDYVAAQPEPVGRVEAAEATGVASHTAKFHLDKLVEEGLLITEFRRLSGRSGPGAGRPSKLYRRSERQVELSLPQRQYELAGNVLAEAVSVAARDGVPVLEALRQTARDAGRTLLSTPSRPPDDPPPDELDVVSAALSDYGYEPRRCSDPPGSQTSPQSPDVVTLANCPFHGLVEQHRELVCGMNLALLGGVVESLGCEHASARLDPAPGRCCVVVVGEPDADAR